MPELRAYFITLSSIKLETAIGMIYLQMRAKLLQVMTPKYLIVEFRSCLIWSLLVNLRCGAIHGALAHVQQNHGITAWSCASLTVWNWRPSSDTPAIFRVYRKPLCVRRQMSWLWVDWLHASSNTLNVRHTSCHSRTTSECHTGWQWVFAEHEFSCWVLWLS